MNSSRAESDVRISPISIAITSSLVIPRIRRWNSSVARSVLIASWMNLFTNSLLPRHRIGCKLIFFFLLTVVIESMHMENKKKKSQLNHSFLILSFPGIPPTYQFVEIPMMAVVNIRGDRLYHEHITWDHASALRQIGVLPEKLPLTVIHDDDHVDDDKEEEKKKKKKYEITLPVAGKETAMKMRNKNSIPSNSMFEYQAKEI